MNGSTLELDETTAKWLERARPDELDERRSKLAELVRQRPDDAQSHFILALLLARQEKLDDALAHLDHVIKLVPDSPLGWTARGNMLRLLGRPDEAKAAYGQALDRKPDDAEAHFGLALTLHEEGNSVEALSHLDRVVALVPENPVGWGTRGDVRASRQDFEGALADFRRATELAPDSSRGHRRQADMLRLLGRPDEAKVAYGQALERAPDDAEAHFGLALTLQEEGNSAEALGHLDRVVALARESPAGWGARGYVLASLRAYDRAVDAIDHALRLAPTDADLWIQRGDALRLWAEYVDDPERRTFALAAIEEALTHDAGNAVAMAISGALNGSMGRFADALADLNSSIDRKPDYDWAIKEKGKVLLRVGSFGEALAAFGKLAASAEERLDAIAGKAVCLRRLGRLSECESELSRIDSGSRDDAKKFVEIARVFEEFEAYDDAILMYRRAIARSPALADAHNEIAWCQTEHFGLDLLEESTAHAQLAVSLSTDEATKGICLDTLGWIWYKRGHLNNAKRFLDQAVSLREPDLLIRKHVAAVEKAIAGGAAPIVAA